MNLGSLLGGAAALAKGTNAASVLSSLSSLGIGAGDVSKIIAAFQGKESILAGVADWVKGHAPSFAGKQDSLVQTLLSVARQADSVDAAKAILSKLLS